MAAGCEWRLICFRCAVQASSPGIDDEAGCWRRDITPDRITVVHVWRQGTINGEPLLSRAAARGNAALSSPPAQRTDWWRLLWSWIVCNYGADWPHIRSASGQAPSKPSDGLHRVSQLALGRALAQGYRGAPGLIWHIILD